MKCSMRMNKKTYLKERWRYLHNKLSFVLYVWDMKFSHACLIKLKIEEYGFIGKKEKRRIITTYI